MSTKDELETQIRQLVEELNEVERNARSDAAELEQLRAAFFRADDEREWLRSLVDTLAAGLAASPEPKETA